MSTSIWEHGGTSQKTLNFLLTPWEPEISQSYSCNDEVEAETQILWQTSTRNSTKINLSYNSTLFTLQTMFSLLKYSHCYCLRLSHPYFKEAVAKIVVPRASLLPSRLSRGLWLFQMSISWIVWRPLWKFWAPPTNMLIIIWNTYNFSERK
jgi:hypothetical protein